MRRSHAPATCACNLECAEAVYTESRGASTGKMAATGKRELLAAAATALAASGAVFRSYFLDFSNISITKFNYEPKIGDFKITELINFKCYF